MRRNAVFFLLVLAPVMAVILGVLGFMTARANLTGRFLLSIGILYPLGLFIVYVVRKRKFWIAPPAQITRNEETGDRSFWFVNLGMIASFFLPPLEYLFFGFKLLRTQWVQTVGIVFIICGVVLFIWARRTLGTSYSGHISVTDGQKLVQNGPYNVVRHPGYAAYLLIAIGISVGYSSLVGLISILLLLLPGLFFRIKVEEKVLASYFGDAYKQYQQRTKRLIPLVW